MAFLEKEKLIMDYNITCPDFRFCKVRHRFESPCELWDCSACWWHYKNCTKTEEPATDNCPYVTCEDLPRPSHNHTVLTVSIVSVLAFAGLFFFFLRRRLRTSREADPEAEAEAEASEEDEDERLPLLTRCRNRCRAFFEHAPSTSDAAGRFRRLIWGEERELAAPPENLHVDLRDQPPQAQEGQANRDQPRPSAPPAYEEIQHAPIIRNRDNRSLVNQNYGNYGSMDRASRHHRMEEVPLMHGQGSRVAAPSSGEGSKTGDTGDDDRTSPHTEEEARGPVELPSEDAQKAPLTHSQSL